MISAHRTAIHRGSLGHISGVGNSPQLEEDSPWQRSIPGSGSAAPKHIKVMELLEELANGSPMSAKAIEKAMGRIQWATACCPLTKSMLQPPWAWKMAVRTIVCWLSSSRIPSNNTHPSCRSLLGRDAATPVHEGLVKPMLGLVFGLPEPHQGHGPMVSLCHHSGRPSLGIQGWQPSEARSCPGTPGHPTSLQASGGPTGPASGTSSPPGCSDNSGNIFSLLNLSAKKPYSAALLMELVLFLHCEGCSIAPNHVPREYNTWADELTHPDFEGFSLDCRLPAPETLFVFPFATRLLSSTGFS